MNRGSRASRKCSVSRPAWHARPTNVVTKGHHAYNEHGEQISGTDARGIVMTRTVDALDRVTAVTYPNPALDIAYTYDDPAVPFSKGRLTRISRHGEAVGYRYDRFGRILQDGALAYGYDANGNPASLTYPGGVEAVTTYDYADRPATLLAKRTGQPDQPLVTAASYLPSGPLSSLTLGNGLTETHTFDSRYFPAGISLSGLLGWTYATDSVGNILSITDTLNAGNNRTYGYQDHHYFLTQGNGPWGRQPGSLACGRNSQISGSALPIKARAPATARFRELTFEIMKRAATVRLWCHAHSIADDCWTKSLSRSQDYSKA